MKNIRDNIRITPFNTDEMERIVSALGGRYFTGCSDKSGHAEIDGYECRTMEPEKSDDDAMFLVRKLVEHGYEVYLYYKQPHEFNAGTRRVEWICETRLPGCQLITWCMSSNLGRAVCGSISNLISIDYHKGRLAMPIRALTESQDEGAAQDGETEPQGE